MAFPPPYPIFDAIELAFQASTGYAKLFAMRITGGRARGIPLKVGKSQSIRPATDMLRAAVFSSLGPLVESRTFIDLFAGTGAYGLEALSRGAAGGHFVENDRRCTGIIAENLAAVAKSCGITASGCKVQAADALRWLPPAGESIGLIFCDPPYPKIPEWQEKLFGCARQWLSQADDDARFIFEMPAELDYKPAGFTLIRRLGSGGKGSPTICIYGKQAMPPVSVL
ncbi:MAG: RsmD family RNA methyltransferase [Verrucomicrobiota bacterium]|nr:RsmD family RNA methyltransferase [Verrucomicrobiota bacterium]